jgi:hypothetical protein
MSSKKLNINHTYGDLTLLSVCRFKAKEGNRVRVDFTINDHGRVSTYTVDIVDEKFDLRRKGELAYMLIQSEKSLNKMRENSIFSNK